MRGGNPEERVGWYVFLRLHEKTHVIIASIFLFYGTQASFRARVNII